MPYYQSVDGLKYLMEQRFLERSEGDFPYGRDFVKCFADIEDHLNNNVHENTVLGAALHGDGLLTDHGIEHIQMVMRNAYFLLKNKVNIASVNNAKNTYIGQLNGCEMFVLLLAIHLHDVGNFFGREMHEKKIYEIIDTMGSKWTLDTAETLSIVGIATAHGGYVGDNPDDKDTLRLLQHENSWVNIPVREVVLAALLRFSDEISDDNTRANRFFDSAGVIPEKNRLFHEYSLSLAPITVTGNVINFKYYVKICNIHTKISLGNGESRYLYDEILRRLKKCLCELEYCRKYADGLIPTTTLNAELNIMPDQGRRPPIKTTKFSLNLNGYPYSNDVTVDSLEFKCGKELDDAVGGVANA